MIELALLNIIKEMKNNNNHKIKRTEPCIILDLKRIISCIPMGYVNRNSEISMYLFSAFTGARNISVTTIQLSDIINIYEHNGEWHVIINISKFQLLLFIFMIFSIYRKN